MTYFRAISFLANEFVSIKIEYSFTPCIFVHIFPVPCFQGFYCPPTVQGAQRCPNGTFTMQENATNLKQCQPCPNKAKQNETWTALQDDYRDAANIFETNCLYYQGMTLVYLVDKDAYTEHKRYFDWWLRWWW